MNKLSENHVSPKTETEIDAETGTAALRRALWEPSELASAAGVSADVLGQVEKHARMRVPLYYLELMAHPNDPIGLQAIPSIAETSPPPEDVSDPLAEDDPAFSPVPHLTHRYPDRALLLVTDQCPMFCRFCMRKRKTLHGNLSSQESDYGPVSSTSVKKGLAHIRENSSIVEVILSGGDPLMLSDGKLQEILQSLKKIPHVERVRIHTRMPCVEPGRITPELACMLGAFTPMFMGVHFNHPREVTPQAAKALEILASQGLSLVSQTVLLKGVNDDPEVLQVLFTRLMAAGVTPYYLHHPDLIPGTEHFRLNVETGLKIVSQLKSIAPELEGLHYVLDTPGGGGKAPLSRP